MIRTALAYLALHSPFVATLAWLARSEWHARFTRIMCVTIALAHAMTIGAWFLGLDDDFAILFYWSMYFLLPSAILYLKLFSKEPEARRWFMYVLLALIAMPLLGIAGILLAFVADPLDFSH